jgi:hypothetical protein
LLLFPKTDRSSRHIIDNDRLAGVNQWVWSVDDRCDLPAFDESLPEPVTVEPFRKLSPSTLKELRMQFDSIAGALGLGEAVVRIA